VKLGPSRWENTDWGVREKGTEANARKQEAVTGDRRNLYNVEFNCSSQGCNGGVCSIYGGGEKCWRGNVMEGDYRENLKVNGWVSKVYF